RPFRASLSSAQDHEHDISNAPLATPVYTVSNFNSLLGCWTGYRLERVEWPQGDSRTLSLYLKPVSQIMYCEQ
ncbi:hypothetical protein, partial [Burkholderia pseudomallei]|uniref:hypothetical protein n=1 Tax=Burkholderia pseudomallei TaxID=28450 RepID=UPI002932AADF